VLTILISPVKKKVITADRQRMHIYPLMIKRKGSPSVPLNDCTDLTDTREVKLYAESRCSFFQNSLLNIPAFVHAGIIYFFTHHHAKEHILFDCYAFVNHVRDIKQHHKDQLYLFWKLGSLPWRLRPGDIVFFMSDFARKFHHAAIYIGKGLYLSIYGAGGDLEVSTLRDIKRDFEAEQAFLATPCKK
jgi:hypothetical protein